MRPCFFLVLAACGKPAPDTELPDVEPEPFSCPLPAPSACGNPASILQGQVSLAPGLDGPSTGSLFIALAHEAYEGAAGGGYHTHLSVPDVDLAAGPVPFALDMCAGGEMWTEENCDYGLVVVLDQLGDQGYANLTPSAGEPATRVAHVNLTCGATDGPCLDVVLDCVDGASCVAFESPRECGCSPESCPSDYALCQ